MLPQRIILAITFSILASAAMAEDWDDCKQGVGTVGIKGCTAWLAQEKDADQRAVIFHRRATVFELAGEYGRSLLDFNQAIELNPNNAGSYVDRALLFFLKEDLDAALADSNRAVAMAPSRDAYQARGFISYYRRDFASAAADWRASSKCSPATQIPRSTVTWPGRGSARTRPPELRANAERLTDRGFRFAAVGLYLGTVSPEA